MESCFQDCEAVLVAQNGLSDLRDSLDSLLAGRREASFHLTLVDDGCDPTTHGFLERCAADRPDIELLTNPRPLGYLESCRRALERLRGECVVLIQSPALVGGPCLQRLIHRLRQDSSIAAIAPLRNRDRAAIELVPGINPLMLDEYLGRRNAASPGLETGILDARFAVLRRELLCENWEAWMRPSRPGRPLLDVRSTGNRAVLAPDVYVYQMPSKPDRDSLRRSQTSGAAAEQTRLMPSGPSRWAPLAHLRQTYRNVRRQMRGHDFPGALRTALGGALTLPAARQEIVDPSLLAEMTGAPRLRVTYVLHNLSLAGGVLSVFQLVNELILLGVDARIAALREYPEVYDWKLLTRPMVFPSPSSLETGIPLCDVLVATHWTTVPWVAGASRRGRARSAAYFVQDYEAWFLPERDASGREAVKRSYGLIEHRIVKSNWLAEKLARLGHSSALLPFGIDLDRFYPREVPKADRPTVIAMARPRTPRRGFFDLVQALHLVKKRLPQARILLFGHDGRLRVPFECESHAIVTDQDHLARLYSQSHVFLDCSHFQGFGRTAMEAMACGTACVLTDKGGVMQYARDGINSLLIPPHQPRQAAEAVIRLLTEERLRNRLIASGLETARGYCRKNEARQTLCFFGRLLDNAEAEDSARFAADEERPILCL